MAVAGTVNAGLGPDCIHRARRFGCLEQLAPANSLSGPEQPLENALVDVRQRDDVGRADVLVDLVD